MSEARRAGRGEAGPRLGPEASGVVSFAAHLGKRSPSRKSAHSCWAGRNIAFETSLPSILAWTSLTRLSLTEILYLALLDM